MQSPFPFQNLSVEMLNQFNLQLEEKLVKETSKTGVKPNTIMKHRTGAPVRAQLASSKVYTTFSIFE